VLGLIEREVMDLAARLIAGRKRREAQEIATETAALVAKKEDRGAHRPDGRIKPGVCRGLPGMLPPEYHSRRD